MIYQNQAFASPEEITSFIGTCEAGFYAQLEDAASKILADCSKIVLLAGPTCSGKTTTAHYLVELLESAGKKIKIISIDNFFKPIHLKCDKMCIDLSKETEEPDFDSADALDLDYFALCARAVVNKEKFYLPVYDFVTGMRTEFHLLDMQSYDVVLFEGIQAVYPEVVSLLPHENDRPHLIFINVDDDITVWQSAFYRRDIRLIRRLVRDYYFRGAHPDYTMFLWNGVIRNEDKNIFPHVELADVRINSLLSYELNLIKQPFLEIAGKISEKSPYYEKVQQLISLFHPIPCIHVSYLPKNSLYREFLG